MRNTREYNRILNGSKWFSLMNSEVKKIKKDVIADLVRNNDIDGLRKKIDDCVFVDTIDNNGWTPIFEAKSSEIIEMLIKQRADINHKDKFGHTALYYAKTQNKDLAEVLEKHGAVAI